MTNFNEMSASALVEFYNTHAEKPVSRFADRKTAIKRCEALNVAESEPEVSGCGHSHCPGCGIHLSNGVLDFDSAVESAGSRAKADQSLEWSCMGCGAEWGAVRYASRGNGNNSEGVAASWNDAEVRKARSTRDAVIVDGKSVFPSMPRACAALGIQFTTKMRKELKAARELTVGSFHFAIHN